MWPTSLIIRRFLQIYLLFTVVVFIYAIVFSYNEPPYFYHPPYCYYLNIEAIDKGNFLPYRTYFDKLNWLLYPFFAILIGIILKYTWDPFQTAWRNSACSSPPLVVVKDGTNMSGNITDSLANKLEQWRIYFFPIGICFSLVWSYFDTAYTRDIYTNESYIYTNQLAAALKDPDFNVKWLFDIQPQAELKRIPAPSDQLIFFALLQIEQIILIGLGFWVLFQIGLQTFAFVALDKLIVNGKRLVINLTPRHSHDYGLGDWNRALDLMYWTIAVALVMPVISKISQPPGDPHVGQIMGWYAIGVLLALPYFVTVFGRERWVNDCRIRLERSTASNEEWELFHKQRLWPMDAQKFEKTGFVICLFLYSIFVSADVGIFKSLFH